MTTPLIRMTISGRRLGSIPVLALSAKRDRIPPNKITHHKLGYGFLKPENGKHVVESEVWRIEGLHKPAKVYAMAYQNVEYQDEHQAEAPREEVAFTIRRAVELYET
jgi:hypothetical protein